MQFSISFASRRCGVFFLIINLGGGKYREKENESRLVGFC